MRAITKVASRAFWARGNFRLSNTEVDSIWRHRTSMYLHGNNIANLVDWFLYISDCGWQTTTTKERLNWILERIWARIFQKKGQWYIEKSGEIIEFNWTYTFIL